MPTIRAAAKLIKAKQVAMTREVMACTPLPDSGLSEAPIREAFQDYTRTRAQEKSFICPRGKINEKV